MKNYKYKIKSFLEDNKELSSNEMTEKLIENFVELDNKYSRAITLGNLSEEDFNDLELELHHQKDFLIHYLLGGMFGYNIHNKNGCNQWYREVELIEETEDNSSLP